MLNVIGLITLDVTDKLFADSLERQVNMQFLNGISPECWEDLKVLVL